MCRNATVRLAAILLLSLSAEIASAQIAAGWRRMGNAAVEEGLPSAATGPVSRVWYSSGGSALSVRTWTGEVWRTEDFETWKPAYGPAPEPRRDPAAQAPEAGAQTLRGPGAMAPWYAFGRFVYRSEDGRSWTNLTAYRNESILGGGLADMDVSPADPDDIAVANAKGVWRSLDGGSTWVGLNDGLPALSASRLLSLPNGRTAAKLLAGGASPYEIDWAPGERIAWQALGGQDWIVAEERLRAAVAARTGGVAVTTAASGDWIYAGGAEGQLWTSADAGQTWRQFVAPEGGRVNAIYVNPRDPRIAIAALSGRTEVLRTVNGGAFWDDATANLPPGGVNGVTADPASGAIYVATPSGVFQTTTALNLLGPPTSWTAEGFGLPSLRTADVRLDEGANQLYVLVDGWGVFAKPAPHRRNQIAVASAADFRARPAAPGALMSIYGGKVLEVRAGGVTAPILGATEEESQIQIPFEVSGQNLALRIQTSGQPAYQMGLPLLQAAPAIFLAPDGAPLLLDADTGIPIDSSNPARAGSRIQILASGLGAVEPAWPTGVPGPDRDAPKVRARVRVYLDNQPAEVTQAALASGYVGFYLVEVQLPKLVNAGAAELYLEAGNQQSNRVRLYLAP